MQPFDGFDITELLLFRMNLDIPAFVRTAVREEMTRDEILGGLQIITNTTLATEKMWRIAMVAQNREFSRNELLVWLHISYGGSMEPQDLRQKLRIPPHSAEEALATLKEKRIIRDGRAL